MQTIKKIKVARTDKTTRGASLRSHVRLDKINNLSFSFRFVFDEALQLKKAPIVEPSIESSALANLSDSLEVFHNNRVSIADNTLANNMVVVPHKAFLSATQSSEQSLGRFCAFALQPSTQVMKFSNLGFRSFEKNTFACYSEVVYSDINTQNPVATRSWSVDFSGKCDVKKQFSFFISDNLKSLIVPVKVFPVVFWNADLNILSFAFDESSEPDFLKREGKKVFVEGDRTRFYNGLDFELGGFKIFRSLCNRFTGKISRKPLPQIFINNMVKPESVAYLGFKSFVNSILHSLLESVEHIKQLLIIRNFQFYGGSSFHKLNAGQLIYKLHAGRCPVLMEVSLDSPPR